jgi:hypothetical protein
MRVVIGVRCPPTAPEIYGVLRTEGGTTGRRNRSAKADMSVPGPGQEVGHREDRQHTRARVRPGCRTGLSRNSISAPHQSGRLESVMVRVG